MVYEKGLGCDVENLLRREPGEKSGAQGETVEYAAFDPEYFLKVGKDLISALDGRDKVDFRSCKIFEFVVDFIIRRFQEEIYDPRTELGIEKRGEKLPFVERDEHKFRTSALRSQRRRKRERAHELDIPESERVDKAQKEGDSGLDPRETSGTDADKDP